MEYVYSKTFFQIQVLKPQLVPWKIGSSYKIGEEKNLFFSYYDQMSMINQQANMVVNEYARYIKESIFEDVRRECFSAFPSRYSCIWLIPHDNLEESLTYWINQVHGNTMLSFRILMLICSGKIHYANPEYLSVNFSNFPIIRQNAFRYWFGINADSNDYKTEALFEGTAKVVKSIDPISLIHRALKCDF